jgi:hypothetical protein
MRWPWSKKPPPVSDELPQADPRSAEKAKQERLQERKEVESRNAYIDWLSKQLAQHNAQNHFSELIIESMRRKHG